MKYVKWIKFALTILSGVALLINYVLPWVLLWTQGNENITIAEAGSIGIIGGADGPTAIFTTTNLNPHPMMIMFPLSLAAWLILHVKTKK